jgi:outer membrane protein assembly factor BamE (lipoprotein component of BamABCDE complex)
MKQRTLICTLALAALALLTGCEQKFTRERFEMIRVGTDSRADVRILIGEPTTDLREQWIYNDLDEDHSAIIYFDGQGYVTGKEWTDAVTSGWLGHHPRQEPPPEDEIRERHERRERIDID